MKNCIGKSQLPYDVEIKNDMIKRVAITRNRGFMLGLYVEMKSGRQPFFCGYHNTKNIGNMILAIAELLGVNDCGDSHDILSEFVGVPCRVASNGIAGSKIAETTWLGNFMDDRWMLAMDIIRTGIEVEVK